jgi:hypothetical protein
MLGKEKVYGSISQLRFHFSGWFRTQDRLLLILMQQ